MTFDAMDLVILSAVGMGVLLLSSLLKYLLGRLVQRILDRRGMRRARKARNPWAP